MADYKKMYLKLFRASEEAINLMKRGQSTARALTQGRNA